MGGNMWEHRVAGATISEKRGIGLAGASWGLSLLRQLLLTRMMTWQSEISPAPPGLRMWTTGGTHVVIRTVLASRTRTKPFGSVTLAFLFTLAGEPVRSTLNGWWIVTGAT